MRAFLGMDGGGTKTAFRLIDADGHSLARVQEASSYYFAEGMQVLENVLRDGIAKVVSEAGLTTADIAYAFFGIPGYGEASSDVEALNRLPQNILGHDRYSCGNDMIGGWAGSLGAQDGINVIAGTGSMAYGERNGTGHRVGGWSEIFGDEGSAYWIGIRGLNLFSRMADARARRGPLYELMREHVRVEHDLDLVGVVVNAWGAKRSAIADLAKVVVSAAAAGDDGASRILHEAHGELVQLVDTTRASLGYEPGETVLVSYSGGLFSVPSFCEGFARALAESDRAYELRAPLFAPDVGSALYAMKSAGAPLPALSGADDAQQ